MSLLTAGKSQLGATCLDGSPGAYYYRAGAESHKVFIHTQGGGYCLTNDDCYARSLTDLGSSNNYPPSQVVGGSGYFSTDPSINPLMWNWTLLYLPYCDGTFQTADVEAPVQYTLPNGTQTNLYYRGSRLVTAAIHEFLTNSTVNLGAATDIVIGGCSAGGVSTFLHADDWANAVPTARVTALPDSGFVISYGQDTYNHNFTAQMMTLLELGNGTHTLPSACLAAQATTGGDPRSCVMAETAALTMATPAFVLNSQYDQWQSQNLLTNTSNDNINLLGSLIRSRVNASLLGPNTNPHHGVILDACYHHCGDFWAQGVAVGGDTQASAHKKWYTNPAGQRAWLASDVYPCDTCCNQQ